MTGQQPFFRNDVLVRDDGTHHRLLSIEELGGGPAPAYRAWLILLGQDKALPHWVSVDELNKTFKRPEEKDSERPAKGDSPGTPSECKPLARPPSAASLAVAERAYARIASLIDDPGIFEPSTRHALLVKHSQLPGSATPKTLLQDLRRWWQGGQTLHALTGMYANSGRPSVAGTGMRGRKPQPRNVHLGDVAAAAADCVSRNPYQLQQVDLDNMRWVIENYYFDKGNRRTLQAALRHLHSTRYTYIDGNGTKCLRHESECPSYRQLSYFLKTRYSLEERAIARKGEKRFAQEDRATLGSVQIECHGAGHIYEFDATIADVVLAALADRTDLVGKPTLYLIIDRATRLIVGFYLGFENASYSPAMQAILSIGEDKAALCARLGLPYDPADWPAHGVLPEKFLADQGELMHKKARPIARALRATISNVPGLRPDWKPLVECGFKMIHQIIAPDTPGYAPDAETKRRRAVNVDKAASLNIEEFTGIIVAAIIAHNKTPQVGYPLTIEQVADGVRPIPRELWAHSVRRRMGVLDRMNFEQVRQELLPRATATITGDGIRFEKMHYSCPEGEALGWFVEGRRARKPLEIIFDYRLVDEIIVFAPDGSGRSFVAKLSKDSVMFRGRSHKEVWRHFRDVAALTGDASELTRQARFQYREQTAPVISAAQDALKRVASGVSRSSRRKDIKDARQAELQFERAQSAGVVPPSRTAIPRAATATAAPAAINSHAARAVVIPLRPADAPQEAALEAATTQGSAASRAPSLKELLANMRRRMD